ncbi:hypothetical protein FOL01_1910 [Weissella jogaejeotgali]|uniref:D-serine dehydratase n=1 Tax=Weissella jogaejeotgali TaxID=1631871 RepID=A0A1L6RDX9_9LACO|nr:hypothetical protein FOL01_1910 [Weissella jogaejeotgali]
MNLETLITDYPQIQDLITAKPTFWRNPDYNQTAELPFSKADILDAAVRLERFSPLLSQGFPGNSCYKRYYRIPLNAIKEYA